jgi:hypothetical protein
MHPVHTFPSHFCKIHSNIILSSTLRSSEWSPPFWFSDRDFVCMIHSPMRAICPSYFIFLDFIPLIIRGPFAKFVDSPYYSESELCGGAATASFAKYLPLQAMHFLQRSTHFSKTCCRPLITSKFLASELPFHGWKSPKIAWGKTWTVWCMF